MRRFGVRFFDPSEGQEFAKKLMSSKGSYKYNLKLDFDYKYEDDRLDVFVNFEDGFQKRFLRVLENQSEVYTWWDEDKLEAEFDKWFDEETRRRQELVNNK